MFFVHPPSPTHTVTTNTAPLSYHHHMLLSSIPAGLLVDTAQAAVYALQEGGEVVGLMVSSEGDMGD